MAFILVLFTLLTHAAPRCVDIFNVPVKTATQEEYLKNYLALNMAFPQYRSTISVGMTAFYFERKMPFDFIYKPLSKAQEEFIYTSMVRAHGAMGITVTVPFADSQFAFASFNMTLPIRIERTLGRHRRGQRRPTPPRTPGPRGLEKVGAVGKGHNNKPPIPQ